MSSAMPNIKSGWQQFQQMSDSDWGRIARQQDDIARYEDHRLRQRQNHHKLLYKQQLEKMISQKQQAHKTMQLLERQHVQEQLRMTNSIDHTPSSPNIFESRLKEQASYNYSVGRERKHRMKSELAEEKSTFKQKFKKVSTEMTEQNEKVWRQRENNKKELAWFYEQQMQGSMSRKEMEKMENHKFQQLAQELELKKQQERNKHINKIKFGYLQNPQSFDLVKHIYEQKQSQKSALLTKITAPKGDLYSDPPPDQKQMKTIETSSFNHNIYLQKLNRKKTLHQRELEEEHQKILTLQQELTEEQEKQARKRAEQRRLLKTELQHQMSQSQENRIRWKRMSQHQTKINKNIETKGVLPGLTKDYKDYKKELIIDSFLKYGRPLPIHSLEMGK